MSGSNRSSRLHIDRLVLRGFSHGDALCVRDAFTATLVRRFPETVAGGALSGSCDEPHRRLPTLTTDNPNTLGRLVAEALLESLNGD